MINPEEEPEISTNDTLVSQEQVEQRKAWIADRQNQADVLNNERNFIERKLNIGETTEKNIAEVEATAENMQVDTLAFEKQQRERAFEEAKVEREQAATIEKEHKKLEIMSRLNEIEAKTIQLEESRAELIADGRHVSYSGGYSQSNGSLELIDGQLATLKTEKDSLKLEHERLSAESEAKKIGFAA